LEFELYFKMRTVMSLQKYFQLKLFFFWPLSQLGTG